MAKFRDIVSVRPPRKPVSLPLISGATVAVALIPLLIDADTQALAEARAFAVAKGVADPKPGDPLYERGLMLHVVLKACVDIDVAERDEPFFGSLEEIGKLLDPDRLAWLFHVQRAHQNAVAPFPKDDDLGGFVRWLFSSMEVDDAREIPFDYLPLRTRQSFLRRLVSVCSAHPSLKLLLGLEPADGESNSTNSSSTSSGEDANTATETSPKDRTGDGVVKVRHAGKVGRTKKRRPR